MFQERSVCLQMLIIKKITFVLRIFSLIINNYDQTDLFYSIPFDFINFQLGIISPGDIVQKTAFRDVFLEQAEKLSLGVKK